MTPSRFQVQRRTYPKFKKILLPAKKNATRYKETIQVQVHERRTYAFNYTRAYG